MKFGGGITRFFLITTLRHHSFNSLLVDRCKKLGGRWDGEERAWVFSGLVESEVEEMDEVYNSNLIAVELKALDDISERHSSVKFLGYSIAKATGRDSGATLSEGVSLISGRVTSGGSMKNWTTFISEGTVIRLMVPELLLENSIDDLRDWDVKRI